MKVEREENDFDVTMNTGEGGLFVNQRGVFLAIYRCALLNKKGGGFNNCVYSINKDGQHIPTIKDCVSMHAKQKETDSNSVQYFK